MIGTIDISITARRPNMPLEPVFAFKDSASSFRIRNVPKKIGDWSISKVYVSLKYPDGQVKSVECKLVGGVYLGTVEGTQTTGISKDGFTVYATGKDENGADKQYTLGVGDIGILEADGSVVPGTSLTYAHLVYELPESPNEGDIVFYEGKILTFYDGEWRQAVDKTSQLSNDSGYVTSSDVPDFRIKQLWNDNEDLRHNAQGDIYTLSSYIGDTSFWDVEFDGLQMRLDRVLHDEDYELLWVNKNIPSIRMQFVEPDNWQFITDSGILVAYDVSSATSLHFEYPFEANAVKTEQEGPIEEWNKVDSFARSSALSGYVPLNIQEDTTLSVKDGKSFTMRYKNDNMLSVYDKDFYIYRDVYQEAGQIRLPKTTDIVKSFNMLRGRTTDGTQTKLVDFMDARYTTAAYVDQKIGELDEILTALRNG